MAAQTGEAEEGSTMEEEAGAPDHVPHAGIAAHESTSKRNVLSRTETPSLGERLVAPKGPQMQQRTQTQKEMVSSLF